MSDEGQGKKTGKDSRHGHRERLRKQYLEVGADKMRDAELLELLLYYAIPRQDTGGLAHQLLDTFGSLESVLDSTRENLMDMGGLSESASILFQLLTDLNRKKAVAQASRTKQLLSTADFGAYLVPRFQDKKEELVYLLGLDAMNRVVGCYQLFSGTVNAVSFSSRKVVEAALNMKATGVVLAHNHPSGIAIPSSEDIQTTRTLSKVLRVMDIALLDHVVVASGDYVSMAESGLLGSI
jgi:DNA repair protein RadC